MEQKHVSITRLRKLLSFIPAAGAFVWKDARRKTRSTAFAGTHGPEGLWWLTIDGRRYRRANLVWFWCERQWIEGPYVDHISKNRYDDRRENLRLGVVGVRWDKRVEKWSAYIGAKGKVIWLGYFREIEKAIEVRQLAEVCLGRK